MASGSQHNAAVASKNKKVTKVKPTNVTKVTKKSGKISSYMTKGWSASNPDLQTVQDCLSQVGSDSDVDLEAPVLAVGSEWADAETKLVNTDKSVSDRLDSCTAWAERVAMHELDLISSQGNTSTETVRRLELPRPDQRTDWTTGDVQSIVLEGKIILDPILPSTVKTTIWGYFSMRYLYFLLQNLNW